LDARESRATRVASFTFQTAARPDSGRARGLFRVIEGRRVARYTCNVGVAALIYGNFMNIGSLVIPLWYPRVRMLSWRGIFLQTTIAIAVDSDSEPSLISPPTDLARVARVSVWPNPSRGSSLGRTTGRSIRRSIGSSVGQMKRKSHVCESRAPRTRNQVAT